MPSVFNFILPETFEVPPNSKIIVTGLLRNKPNYSRGIFEMKSALTEKKPLLLARMVAHTTSNEISLRFMNNFVSVLMFTFSLMMMVDWSHLTSINY